ncbi:MAG: glycosyltransferase [Actinomycetota bacterium]|nr:glycosyltransferase [Actinomycetota bacterium]
MIKVFIGYDSNETVAYHVLSHTILKYSSQPVSITPIVKNHLTNIYNRERTDIESTDFSFTRFLVPYLCGYQGWAIFIDCDMLFTTDISELWNLRDDAYSLMCVKHEYLPSDDKKFLGSIQTKYEKKNWSSVMLFNNSECQALTPEVVASQTGLYLHQFKWLASEALIGSISPEWNFLVGESKSESLPKLIHYTLGGPYFVSYQDCQFSDNWRSEYKDMISAAKG